MNIIEKIGFGIGIVVFGATLFMVFGTVNCDGAKNITFCKQAVNLCFWSGQIIAMSGIGVLVHTVFFSDGKKKSTTEKIK